MALYLLPTHKTMIQLVARASDKPGTPVLDEANSAVLFAEAPRTKWARVKGAISRI
jgi:hypothetical protein